LKQRTIAGPENEPLLIEAGRIGIPGAALSRGVREESEEQTSKHYLYESMKGI